MLDTLVKLTETLTHLLKYRAERTARTFDELVKPFFDDLKKIHQDYLGMLEKARSELKSDMPVGRIAMNLRERRLAEEPLRRSIAEQISVLVDSPSLKSYRQYFQAIMRYFDQSPFGGFSSPTTIVLRLIDAAAMAKVDDDSENRRRLLSVIEDILDEMRQHWILVSKEYAELLGAKRN